MANQDQRHSPHTKTKTENNSDQLTNLLMPPTHSITAAQGADKKDILV